MIRLLFSSAGRRVELINCFKNAAIKLGISLEVIAIDMEPSWSPACQVADYAYKVTRCTSPQFIDEVLSICQRHKINLIIPTIDTELIPFAENREKFAKHNIKIHLSTTDVVRVVRDKEKTAKVLSAHGIPVPCTWSMDDALQEATNLVFPLIVKPPDGSCSQGIAVINSLDELKMKAKEATPITVQELCHGKEFTINCFYDRSKGCVSCVPHFRKFVRDGEVCFAKTVRVPEFKTYADKFFRILPGIYGTICFQGFMDDSGLIKIVEINARFGGGYPICDKAGGTFAKWIVQDLSGQVPPYHDEWREGVRMLRYDAAIFT